MAYEGVPRRTLISCSLPQACEYCVHEECKRFTPNFQEVSHKHATNENGEQEDVEISTAIECIVEILKRAITSSNSPPQEGDKDECSRYKSTLIKFLLMMINMENSHIIFGESLHVPFVVWLTIMFQGVVGRR